MDRGAWWATVHGFEKSQTWLKWLSRHACKWNLSQLFKKSWATYGSWRYLRLFLPWEWGVVLHDLCVLVTPRGTQSDPRLGQSWTLKSCTNTHFFRLGIDFSQNLQECVCVCVCVCARACVQGWLHRVCISYGQHVAFVWSWSLSDLWALGEPSKLSGYWESLYPSRVHSWRSQGPQRPTNRRVTAAPLTEHLLCAGHGWMRSVCTGI